MLDLYTETKQWKKVVETIERFIALENDPVRRGAYYHAAATIQRDELKSLDTAQEYYGKALDNFFADPNKLPASMLPRALKAFEAIDRMLTKDDLQARWVRRLCHKEVQLPRHTVPAAHGFVAAGVAGMGWGLHPQSLIASHLQDGSLVEIVPGTPLDVSLHWQHARVASPLLDGLSREVLAAAARALLPP